MALFGLILGLCIAAAKKSDRYNVLSLEAGAYAGILTAKFVDFMEERSYVIAMTEGCIKKADERESQRIYISELFDMVAGSETGAIIASTLAIKDKDGK